MGLIQLPIDARIHCYSDAICYAISSISTAVNIYTTKEMDKISAEWNVFNAKVEDKEEELDKAKEALTPYLGIDDILEITFIETFTQAYVEGVDAMMYRAIGVDDYGKLYDYDAMVSDFLH